MNRVGNRFLLTATAAVLAVAPVWSQSYSGGSGTLSDPYQIANKADLKYLSENSGEWTKHFMQIANIAFSASDFQSGGDFYNSGEGFIPIGTTASPFTGSYDGNGTTIDGLTIDRTSENCSMFGRVNSSNDPSIANLGLTNVSIVGAAKVGGLIGILDAGTITNCYTTGSVSGTGSVFYIGGLIGYLGSGTISYSYSTCVVQGGYSVGGLVGYSSSGAFSNCYARGNVGSSSDQTVGGFAGKLDGGSVANCYSTGTVTAYAGYGGFTYTSFASVTASFWNTDSESYGGFFAYDSAGGRTTAQMQTQSTFSDSGWNFTDTWEISGSSYPALQQPTIYIIALQPATDINTVTVTLNAKVNARTDTVTARFLYGISSEVYTDSVTTVPDTAYGDSLTTLSASLTGLSGGTTYFYTVSATTTNEYQYRTEKTFTTGLATVTTGPVTGATSGSVTVSGSVDPGTDLMSVRFLYGTTSGTYTDSVSAVPGTATGDSVSTVSGTLTGLVGGTMYYYALSAQSTGQYVQGGEKSFSAPSAVWGSSLLFDANSTTYAKAQGVATTVTDDFTIEAWVKWDGTTGTQQLIASNGQAGADGYGAYLWSDGTLAILISAKAWLTTSSTPDSGIWNHIALVRDTGTWSLYKDGVSLTLGGDTPMDPNTPSSNFFVGGDSATSYFFNGEIDEVRVSNIARYRSSFTPFLGPFPADGNAVALYHFNDGTATTAGDSSGNGNDMTLYDATWNGSNNPNEPSDAATTPGHGLDFPGTYSDSNYVEVPYSSTLNPSDNFSVEAWAKVEGGDSVYRCIVGSEGTPSTAEGYALYADFNNNWAVVLGDSVASHTLVEGTPVIPDTWTHIAMTFSGGTVKLYVNGNLAVTQSSISLKSNSSNPFRIGDVAETPGVLPFNGKIDEVRVWNLVRTQQEIRESMHQTVPSSSTGLVAYFQLNEGTGTLIQDQVTGFAGVMTGSVTWSASTIPVGTSTSTSVSSFTTGTASLGNISLTTTDPFDNSVDLTATEINLAPNQLPVGSTTYLDSRYWVVNAFGTPGTFAVNMTFTVPGPFTNNGSASSSYYTLYHRGGAADTAWAAVVSAASAVESTSVTFDNVTSFSQFMIGTDDPLPVQMGTVSAERGADGVVLRWNTVTEVDNAGWEIERRSSQSTVVSSQTEAKVWEKIGFVEGAGTITSPKEYTFTDSSPITNHQLTRIYRLKQLDRSGSFSYSQEIRVELSLSAPRVFHLSQNYPNPFNPSTTISYTLEADGPVSLKVYDLLGREVATLVNEVQKAGVFHEMTFDASGLASGVYFSRLTAGGKQMMRRLVVLK